MPDVEHAITEISTAMQTELRLAGTSPQGCSHIIHQLIDPKGTKYILRIPNDEFAALLDKRGHKILKYLSKTRPGLLIPKLILEASSFSLHEYLEGEPIKSWNLDTITETSRHTLLDGIAEFLVYVWTCPAPPDTESVTYRSWLYDEVDKAFLRSLTENSGWCDPVTFLIRRARVEDLVPRIKNERLAIKHGDLHAWNVLADNNCFSGVIDWDTAQVVPLAATIQHPLLLANIPGWINDAPEGMTFEDDRVYLEKAVQRQVDSMTSPDAQCIPALLSSSFERQFFEMSLRNKVIDAGYTSRYMSDVEVDKSVVFKQLNAILSKNPHSRDNAGLVRLCSRFDFEL